MNNASLAKRDLFDWLDDLCVRFIINLPLEELAEAERTCFQIEEAQWFYEDFIRPLDPDNLPVLNLRNFYMLICQYCPILCDYPAEQHAEAFERFLKYKTRVPVRGAILLNEAMDAIVLVKGWKKNANWSFPRGKINKEESDLTCAVREVYEETGYDLEAAGLVSDGENTKNIEVAMREQSLKLFVFRGVPMDTHFEPRTRKEISKIQWYKLSELPTMKKNKQQIEEKGEALANNANKFYMVAPFLGHLKKWIGQQRKLDKANPAHRAIAHHQAEASAAATDLEDHPMEESGGARSDIEKLLDAHRRRKQKVLQNEPQQVPSDLPEVSPAVAQPERDQPKMHLNIVQKQDQLNKIDLLAILKGGKSSSQELPPQTPAAQMIDEPVMPHSPPHHHLSRMPTLPVAPTLGGTQKQAYVAKDTNPIAPQVQAARPPTESERHVAQARHLNHGEASAADGKRFPVLAPYQQTGDPKIAPVASQVSSQGPSAPPASNLPKPVLSQQKATLLGLFKQGNTNPGPTAMGSDPKADNSTPKSSLAFVPSQVLSRSSTEKASTVQPVSDQKAHLLAMFKTPSASTAVQTQDKDVSLQPPPVPIELSALPSPGHSREQSRAEPEPKKPNVGGIVTVQKRPSTTPLKQNPTTSATISGPLNIPQFDMIAKHHREAKDGKRAGGINQSENHPVTILPRPVRHTSPVAALPPSPKSVEIAPNVKSEHKSADLSNRKQKSAQAKQLLMPVKIAQPPTPNLEAQSTPPKQFHPQILKRPAQLLNDSDNMSPIQPLPSPKHAITDHHRRRSSQQTQIQTTSAEHKKSLLSLFSASSPGISPPSTTTPAGADREKVPDSLISPLSESRGQSYSSKLEKQASWKENELFAPTGFQQQQIPSAANTFATAAASANGIFIGQPNDTPPPAATDEKKRKENYNTEVRPALSNGPEQEPERSRSTKETPDELKNLLLGRLANIKV